MKYIYYSYALSIFFFLAACSGADNKTDASGVDYSIEDVTTNPSAKITHEDGWTIVSKIEDGNTVYWFLPPDVDNVTPAIFKKKVYSGGKSKLETEIVSQCEAPKQTCDDLFKKFNKLSEKYR